MSLILFNRLKLVDLTYAVHPGTSIPGDIPPAAPAIICLAVCRVASSSAMPATATAEVRGVAPEADPAQPADKARDA